MKAANLPPNLSVKQENKSKTAKNGGPHDQNRKTESAFISPCIAGNVREWDSAPEVCECDLPSGFCFSIN